MALRRTFVIAAMAAFTVGCGGGESIGGLGVERTFTINLTQAEEVPIPQPTSATGVAQVLVYATRIDFTLSATNITGITMAHIHSGAPGVAGPIVVTLFQPASATGAVNGVFATGSLNAGNLPAGVTIESLKTLLAGGNSYINVHTSVNQTGEIRGQLR
jgi:hypothetical protein